MARQWAAHRRKPAVAQLGPSLGYNAHQGARDSEREDAIFRHVSVTTLL